MKIDKNLKEAIINMPQKEKDKLLLRLIRKDNKLIERLEFELVSTDTVEIRRQNILDLILNMTGKQINSNFESQLYCVRECFAMIKHHVDITKDKHGEILLSVILLENVSKLEYHNFSFWRSTGYLHSYANFIMDKIFKTLVLISSSHEDYRIDFEDGLNNIYSNIVQDERMMKFCIRKGFEVNWLKNMDFPNDLKDRATRSKKLKLQ